MSKYEIKEFIHKIQIIYERNEEIKSFVNLIDLISSLEELDSLVEMYEVKSVIISHIQALIVLNLKNKTNILDEHMLHTVFYGHPGVGKSKTAKILTRIWKSLGIIKCCHDLKVESNFSNMNNLSMDKLFSLTSDIIKLRKLYLNLYEEYLQSKIKDCKNMWKNNEELWNQIKDSLNEISKESIKSIDSEKINSDENIFSSKDCQVVIAGREHFVAEYTGQTAIKTLNFLNSCRGKCIIIEEAYLLYMSEADNFGMEALTVLNRYMDEHPRDVVIIFTGYEDKLKNSIFKAQPGLIRRCQLIFNLVGYTPEGLSNIFINQLKNNGWEIEDEKYIVSFFKINFQKFENYGGDTEKLCFNCKMIYSRDYMNKMFEENNFKSEKIITNKIIEEAYEIYLKNLLEK